jgi:hypothetical protein
MPTAPQQITSRQSPNGATKPFRRRTGDIHNPFNKFLTNCLGWVKVLRAETGRCAGLREAVGTRDGLGAPDTTGIVERLGGIANLTTTWVLELGCNRTIAVRSSHDEEET